MVMFVNSTSLKKSLFRLLFAKLFWDCLMHIWKTALMEVKEFENFKIWGDLG